jgi:hypothetical protein
VGRAEAQLDDPEIQNLSRIIMDDIGDGPFAQVRQFNAVPA